MRTLRKRTACFVCRGGIERLTFLSPTREVHVRQDKIVEPVRRQIGELMTAIIERAIRVHSGAEWEFPCGYAFGLGMRSLVDPARAALGRASIGRS
jgi:hypothetical protein